MYKGYGLWVWNWGYENNYKIRDMAEEVGKWKGLA